MAEKKWNWQQDDWPVFSYNPQELKTLETEFLKSSGLSLGVLQSLPSNDKGLLTLELVCDEAVKTSEIEGEILDRDSVRSSIIQEFGLSDNSRLIGVKPSEQGIARMMNKLYTDFSAPLTHDMLYAWHSDLMYGRHMIKAGNYRTHEDDMKVVSGPIHKPKTHFVAPASKDVPKEMDQFVAWFNKTAPGQKDALPPLTRAGIAHLYFLSIHPFEDGNGRISRALVTKALSQELKAPVLTAVSSTINANRKEYYAMLGIQSKGNEITPYLKEFGKTLLDAQELTVKKLEFIMTKTKLLDHFRGKLNPRQEKAVLRIFKEGLKGFEGGLSANNYSKITKAKSATTTRDLQDLVEKGVFIKTGKLKGTRYQLNLGPFQKQKSLDLGQSRSMARRGC